MVSRRVIIWGIIGLFPLILLLTFWANLRHGIRVDRLEFAGFKVERLYLKLDNRLLLHAQKVRIPRSKTPQGPRALQKGLERLHRALEFFDDIAIEDLGIAGHSYRLIYRDKILYLKSPDFEAAGMVYDRGKEMEVQFPLVRILHYDITLSGELHYRYRDSRILASGFYHVPDLSGSFSVSREGDEIDFRIDSMKTGSLKRLLALVPMSREAREWLEDRISAKSYRLEYLQGRGRYEEATGTFHPDLTTLQGAARLQNLRILFNDTLLPITATKARVVLQKGNLYFYLDGPRYGKRRLAGARAALLQLYDPKRLTLLLRIHYKGRIDWQILKILHAYGLKVALGQKSGQSEARVDLDIPLAEGPVKLRGVVRLGKGMLEFHNRQLRIGGGELAFTSHKVVIRALRIEEKDLQGTLKGRIDLRRHQAKLILNAKRIRLKAAGRPVVSMEKQSIPLEIGWGTEGYRIRLPSLDASLIFPESKRFRFEIDRLSRWMPWLQGIPKVFRDGKLKVEGPLGGPYKISGTLLWPSTPFYTRSGPVERFPFQAKILNGALLFEALGGKIAFRSDQRVLHIDGLNVNARRLLKIIEENKEKTGAKSPKLQFSVLGSKSIIRYGRYVLITDNYRLDLHGKKIRFSGTLGNDNVLLVKEGEVLNIEARQIGDRMLHALIHFNGLRGGRYTLHLSGTEAKGYTGEILIEGGVLRDIKAYNDMIALFNTVPALLSFSDPGFSKKGFEIKKGRILFTLKGETLQIDSILLEGRSATIAGKGTVDLQSKALAIELAIRTARKLGKTLGQIPLVGYILFGKDKSLTAGVKISGTLEKPKVTTNPVGEALLYPLELLKRTLTAPMNLEQESQEGAEPSSTEPKTNNKPGTPSTKEKPNY